jgi:phosphoenolpyruvate carboxykinase (GTP)
VRRDPFAMLPFTGYNMSDYFAHWLRLGEKLQRGGARLPKIFCVNWFRKGPDGKFVWPGSGENMRVLQWMLDRVDGKGHGVEHVFGISPRYEDLSWQGLAFTPQQFAHVMSIDAAAWRAELALHAELFQRLQYHLPPELSATKARIEQRLAA